MRTHANPKDPHESPKRPADASSRVYHPVPVVAQGYS
jgi:hypothetical protein